MDILIRFWCEENNKVTTKYLTSFFYGRATAADIVQKMISYQEKSKILFERLFYISCDGPNINKTIWKILNDSLKKIGHGGLIPFSSCSLHVVHNVFEEVY